MNHGDESSGMVLLTGNSHPELARLISDRLGVRMGDAVVYNKSNRETSVDIKQSVRAKHVFILQTANKNVNNNIMELTSMAKTITVILPYAPYSKQCRMFRRSSIPMKLVADMICKAGERAHPGWFRLISIGKVCQEVRSPNLFIVHRQELTEIQGFFSIPVDNLRASPFLLQYIKDNIHDFKNSVIVAKGPGGMNKATSFADRLRVGVAVIHGEHKDAEESGLEDGRQSPPPQSPTAPTSSYELFPSQVAKEKPPLTVVGDVGGRIAIIVDDIIDDAQSFVSAAEVLKARGAYKIYVIATHGLLSTDAPAQLEASPINEVIVTNSVPHELQKLRCHKIKTVDISLILCEAIRRIYNNESMGLLFRDLTLDD